MSFALSQKSNRFKARKGKPYFFMYVFLLVLITVTSFLLEGIAFFNTPFSLLMTDLEFYVVFGVCGLCLIPFLYISFACFKAKPSFFWASLLLALFVCNAIAIYLFPGEVSGTTTPISSPSFDWSYTFEEHFRIRYVLAFLIACFDMYILFGIAPQLLRSSRATIILHYGFIAVTIIALVWSFVTESDIYAYYFSPEMEADPSKYISSFFLNRNTYAAVLFVAMASLGVINADSHHFWNYILMGVFYIELFFTISKTGILVGTGYLVVYVFYRFIVNFKYHKVRAFTGLILFWVAVISIFIVGELQLIPRNNVFMKLYLNFKEAFVNRVEHGFLDYRVEIWTNCYTFQSTNILYLIFGVGEINALTLIRSMWNASGYFYFTHNGFVHQLFAGGYIRLIVYILLLLWILYVSIVNATNRRRTTIPCLLGILALLAQSITETTAFLGADTKVFLYGLMFVVPLFTDYHQDRHPEIKDEQSFAYSEIGTHYSYVVPAYRKALLCMSVLMPFLFFFLGTVPLMSSLDTMWYHQFRNSNILGGCLAVLCVSPAVFFLGFQDTGFKGRMIVSLNFIISFAAVAFIILSPKPIMAVFASVFLAVWAAFVLAISTNKLTLKSVVGLLKVYGSIGFVSVLFIGTNHLFVFLMPNIFNEASLTLNICLLIDEILGYIVVVYTLTPFHGFGYPLGHLFYRLDRRISYGLSKYEEKTDLREEIYSGDYVAKYYKKELHRH